MVQDFWEVLPERTKPHWLEVVDPDGWHSAIVRFDGCIHYFVYENEPLGPNRTDTSDDSYLHICSLDTEIARLQALRAAAILHFGEDWPNC